MGCGTSFVKYVLFFFNLLFALCGLGLLGLGVAFKLKMTEITSLLDGKISAPPLTLIIIGAIVFVVAFFGCCGAVRESHCMIVTYAIFMLVIIIIQVVIAILVFVYIGDIDHAIADSLKVAFDKVLAGDNEPATEAYNIMQSKFECCGLNGPTDYGLSITIPKSCCSGQGPLQEAFAGTCTIVSAYSQGCVPALTNAFRIAGKTIGGVAIGVAVIEIIGAIFALCLANSIRNADRRYA